MIKTDKKSLEELSFKFSENDIATFRKIIEYTHPNKLLKISDLEYQNIVNGLDNIGKLKLDKKIYAFQVHDMYVKDEDKIGVELYLRQGDKLEDLFLPGSRDYVYSVKDTLKFLKKNNLKQIYTGPMANEKNDFLDLPHTYDAEDPIIREILSQEAIIDFKSDGIEVIVLDYLI